MRIERSMKNGRSAACVIAATALVLTAASAQAAPAEPCKDPADVALSVYSTFFDGMDDFFGLDDSKLCDKLTKTAVSACFKAVQSAQKCNEQLAKSVFKDQKLACKTTGSDEASCTDFYTNEYNNWLIVTDSSANFGNQECGDEAESFWTVCMDGFPAP